MATYLEKGKSRKFVMNPESLYLYTSEKDLLFNELIKHFPIKHYDPTIHKWEVPVSSLSLILRNFPGIVIKGNIDEYNKKRFESLEQYKEYLKTLEPEVPFTFKTKPDPHQIEWFNSMLKRDRVILGDPMGLGKTKEYLDVCEYRKQAKGYKKILFICKSKHKYNMAREIEYHTNSDYIVVDGDEESRLQSLRDFYQDDSLYYLVIGYEMAAFHRDQLRVIGEDIGFDGIVLDEFNKIKNWVTTISKKSGKPHLTIEITRLIENLNPELLILGSGTPMSKHAPDLYAPLRLTGAEHMDIASYTRRYCRKDTWGKLVGAQNEPELSDKLWSVMIRRPKDLLELPEPRVTYMPIKMLEEQASLYRAAKLNIQSQLRGTKIYGASALALLTRLRQITTDPMLVDSNAESAKHFILQDYASDVFENDEKIIVYSIYRQETLKLYEMFSGCNPAYVDGTIPAKEAQNQVDMFQRDPKCKIFIGSLHAAKESYTLTEANHVFYMDLSWTVSDNEQARDRAHRRGQKRPVNIMIPFCQGTIDERVIDILARDAQLIEEVVDGGKTTNRMFDRHIIDHLLS
jgi:SNF2 family DNA or RNA helicase